jgi:hypothetical protein
LWHENKTVDAREFVVEKSAKPGAKPGAKPDAKPDANPDNIRSKDIKKMAERRITRLC